MSYYLNNYINPFAYFTNRPVQVQVITPIIPIHRAPVQVVHHHVSNHRYPGCTHYPPCESSEMNVPKGQNLGNYVVVEYYVGYKVINRPSGCTITPSRQEVRLNLRVEGVPNELIVNGVTHKLKTSASFDNYGIRPKNVTLNTAFQNSIPK